MWKKIGEIGVDSGQMMLIDPCYMDSVSYDEACAATDDLSGCGIVDNGLAFAALTAYGDGEYPVYVRYGDEGRIAAMKIEFMEDPEYE